MKAVIPAAGVGTRLRPHTYTAPKALLSVAGKPIIGHILDQVIGLGIDEVVVIVGYLGHRVREYVEGNIHIKATFIQQEDRKGLGHSVYLTRNQVGDSPILIIYGDTIFEGDISRGMDTTVDGCIGVKEVEDPRRFGVVELKGKRVIRLVEKPEHPPSNLVIVGVNFINNAPLLFDCLQRLIEKGIMTRGEYQLTDALQLMIEDGAHLTTFPLEGWFDCGKTETLLATNRHLLERSSGSTEIQGVVINPPVYVAQSAVVENTIIGPYVSVAEGAVIQRAIVQDSIVGERARVIDCLLRSSIVGAGASVRGRFTLLNLGDSTEVAFG